MNTHDSAPKKARFRSDLVVERIQHMGSDEIVCKAARVSTGKDQEPQDKIDGLIRYLARNAHTSPFEHAAITYRFEVPIFVAREHMRHRTQSFNEISGRYAELPGEFYLPPAARPLVNRGSGAHPDLQHSDDAGMYVDVVADDIESFTLAYEKYQQQIAAGVATEVARNPLPVSTYTAYYATANLLNWLKFLVLRTAPNAQWEIRETARQVHDDLAQLFPLSVSAWKGLGQGVSE